jgi:hypothetical protein
VGNNLTASTASWPAVLKRASGMATGPHAAPALVRTTLGDDQAHLTGSLAGGAVARSWEDGMSIDTAWGDLLVRPDTDRHVVGDPAPGGGAITYKSIAAGAYA